jgi:hypothetical protein
VPERACRPDDARLGSMRAVGAEHDHAKRHGFEPAVAQPVSLLKVEVAA